MNTESFGSIGDIPGVRGTSSISPVKDSEYPDSGELSNSGLVLGEDSGVSRTELPTKALENDTGLSPVAVLLGRGSDCDLRHALFGCFLLLGLYL